MKWEFELVVPFDELADGAFVPEDLAGRRFGHDHGERGLEGGRRVPFDQFPGKDVEDGPVDVENAVLEEILVPEGEHPLDRGAEADGVDDLREVLDHGRPDGGRRPGRSGRLSRGGRSGRDPVDITGAAVVSVVGALVADIGQDEEAAGYPQRQAHDVDEGKKPVLDEIPIGDLDIVGDEHFGLLGALRSVDDYGPPRAGMSKTG